MWNYPPTNKELTEVKGHIPDWWAKSAAIGFDSVLQAIPPHVAHRPMARDRFHNLGHRVGIGKAMPRVHEPQQVARRVGNALVHRVISSAVGLGLPVREPRLTPRQIVHDMVARSTVDHDVLDASLVTLGSHTVHHVFQSVEVVEGDRYH